MARGENVFHRKDGRYEARYIKGRRADGKPLYGFCYGRTYEEAKGKADRAREEIAMGRRCLKRVMIISLRVRLSRKSGM